MDKVQILNVSFDNVSEELFLQNFNSGMVVTPNVDFLIRCQKDLDFYKIINSADWVLCDSQIIYLTSKLFKNSLRQKLSGSDIFPKKFCEYHSKSNQIKIFLMGSKKGIAERAAKNINTRLSREIITNWYSPKYGYENDQKETTKMIELFNQSGANVLALGTGSPKSEKWLNRHKNAINAKMFMSIGATIDFQANNIKRAPEIVSKLGLEWLYRLVQEPKRLWKRYIIEDSKFLWLAFKEITGVYKNPFK